MKKTHKIVMLPSIGIKSSPTILVLEDDGTKKLHLWTPDKRLGWNFQHLYILSDEEIKEGDWYYRILTGEEKSIQERWQICKCIKSDLTIIRNFDNFKKIIATTDKSINGKSDSGLQMCLCGTWQMDNEGYPKCKGNCHTYDIHESFIQAYIKAYNEGKPITEVDLETVETSEIHFNEDGQPYWPLIPKTRSDNTVIIHKSKTYSREEVEALLNDFNIDINRTSGGLGLGETSFQRWINQHL